MMDEPIESDPPESVASALESLEVSIDAATGHLRSIADSLSSIRDSVTRIAESLAILVATHTKGA